MTLDHNKFTYWKQQQVNGAGVTYAWFLRNKATRNAIEFHGIQDCDDPKWAYAYDNEYRFVTYGIERHGATPDADQPDPDHEHCFATGGKCWHDGSSLLAFERLGHVNPQNCDDEVWYVLHSMYRSWFGEQPQ